MDELKTKVYEAIGEASMCWDPRPNSQIFKSDRAKEIGDALFAAIETELAASRRQLARAEDFIQLAAEQHCPQNPETSLGRTLKMLINDAKEYFEAKENEALRKERKAYREAGSE